MILTDTAMLVAERDAALRELKTAELAAATLRCGGRFALLGMELGDLCDQKNKAYGDSAFVVSDVLKVLCPNGIPPEKYELITILSRCMDKWARLLRVGNNELGEDAARDLVGYSLILAERLRAKQED
jgi:hypothetical protein